MKIRKHLFGMICAISLEFVLGMILNLFGVPPQERTATHPEPVFASVAMMIHAPLGLLILLGGAYTCFSAWKGHPVWKKYGVMCLIAVMLAAFGGIGVVSLGEEAGEVASFVMALGSLLSLLAYFVFYTKTGQVHEHPMDAITETK